MNQLHLRWNEHFVKSLFALQMGVTNLDSLPNSNCNIGSEYHIHIQLSSANSQNSYDMYYATYWLVLKKKNTNQVPPIESAFS